MFVTHGAAWAALKTEGALHARAVAVRSAAHWVFVALVVVATIATVLMVSDQPGRVLGSPLGWVMLVLLVGGVVYTRLSIARGGDGGAFLGSAAGILGLVGLVAVGNYPNLVPALDHPERSLTVEQLGVVGPDAHGDADHRVGRGARSCSPTPRSCTARSGDASRRAIPPVTDASSISVRERGGPASAGPARSHCSAAPRGSAPRATGGGPPARRGVSGRSSSRRRTPSRCAG